MIAWYYTICVLLHFSYRLLFVIPDLLGSPSARHSLGSNRAERSRRGLERTLTGLSDNSEDEPEVTRARIVNDEDEDADASDRSDTTSIFSFENDDETTPLNENSRKR